MYWGHLVENRCPHFNFFFFFLIVNFRDRNRGQAVFYRTYFCDANEAANMSIGHCMMSLPQKFNHQLCFGCHMNIQTYAVSPYSWTPVIFKNRKAGYHRTVFGSRFFRLPTFLVYRNKKSEKNDFLENLESDLPFPTWWKKSEVGGTFSAMYTDQKKQKSRCTP